MNAGSWQATSILGLSVSDKFSVGLKKYDQQTYELIMEMFDSLPLGCLINSRFLCVHGGISHEIKSLEDIKRIDRFH